LSGSDSHHAAILGAQDTTGCLYTVGCRGADRRCSVCPRAT